MKTIEDQNGIFPLGEKTPAEYFTGPAWLNVLVPKDETGNYTIGNVVFELQKVDEFSFGRCAVAIHHGISRKQISLRLAICTLIDMAVPRKEKQNTVVIAD